MNLNRRRFLLGMVAAPIAIQLAPLLPKPPALTASMIESIQGEYIALLNPTCEAFLLQYRAEMIAAFGKTLSLMRGFNDPEEALGKMHVLQNHNPARPADKVRPSLLQEMCERSQSNVSQQAEYEGALARRIVS